MGMIYYKTGEDIRVGDLVSLEEKLTDLVSIDIGSFGIVKEITRTMAEVIWFDDEFGDTWPMYTQELILVRRGSEKLLTWI